MGKREGKGAEGTPLANSWIHPCWRSCLYSRGTCYGLYITTSGSSLFFCRIWKMAGNDRKCW